jgi:hypothetical protein
VADAPSPAAIVDEQTGLIGFENTGVLWGNEEFSLMALWSGSVIWTDPTAYYQSIVWTAGELFPTASSGRERDSGPDSETVPDGEMPERDWPDNAAAWSAIRNTSDGVPIDISPLSLGFQDPK